VTAGPLHYRGFRHALVARVISIGASWMQTVAAGWLTYNLTHSATAVGLLTVLARGPALVLTTAGGQLADRFDPRRLALVLSVAQVIPPALLAVAAWTGDDSLPAIYATVFAGGVLAALSNVAVTWVTAHSVPEELMKSAIGESSVAFNVSRLVGPLIGGGLIAAAGVAPCFAVNAASFLAMAWALWTIHTPHRERQRQHEPLRTSVHRVLAEPLLAVLFTGLAVFALIVAPLDQLAPAIARRQGEGAHLLGFLLAGLALGGIIGNWVRARLARRGIAIDRLVSASLLATAVGMLGLAAAPDIFVAVGAMICCGIFWDVLFVECLSAMQTLIPSLAGVLTGLFYTVAAGGVIAGALLIGLLMDAVGTSLGLAIAAGTMAIYGVWRLSRPEPEPLTVPNDALPS
jgi:predicted MFS family arabinose efflux permease